jgi:hypothetical protein
MQSPGGQATRPTTREQVRINVGSWVIHVGLTVIVSPPLNPPTCRGHKVLQREARVSHMPHPPMPPGQVFPAHPRATG